MPKKKVVLQLPPVPGATQQAPGDFHKSSSTSNGSTSRRGKHAISFSSRADEEEAPDSPRSSVLDSKASTDTPTHHTLMTDKARGTAKLLEESMKLVSNSHDIPRRVVDEEEWEVQSPEQILEEVRQVVQARKPWRQLPDDSLLEKKRLVDCGAHIPLPDNRVRLCEDQLSLRTQCELLDMEMPPYPIPPMRPQKSKTKGSPRKVQNPWYLPPKKWYSGLQDKTDNPEERSPDFPYANAIYNLSEPPKKDESADAKQLPQINKETHSMVESYKQFMKGNRLPHFLL